MLSSIKQRMNRDEEEGFTLIELMVVLLIIAILLAIAIPTFLGARNTANARSTQENLRNALTAEQTYWTSNQTFGTSTNVSSVEGALSFVSGSITTAGGNTVSVTLYNYGTATAVTTGTADSVVIMGYGKDGNCYAIDQSNNGTTSFTAYTAYKQSSGCAVPAQATAAPASGSAGSNVASSSTSALWYTSF